MAFLSFSGTLIMQNSTNSLQREGSAIWTFPHITIMSSMRNGIKAGSFICKWQLLEVKKLEQSVTEKRNTHHNYSLDKNYHIHNFPSSHLHATPYEAVVEETCKNIRTIMQRTLAFIARSVPSVSLTFSKQLRRTFRRSGTHAWT